MQKEVIGRRKRHIVFVFAAIIAFTMLFYFASIRQRMYEESSSHLNEVSRQMAASIGKQTGAMWNMVDMFYRYFLDMPAGGEDAFDRYTSEKKDVWGFETLCLVDENAIYYDKANSLSLLSQKEVSMELLTQRKPVILDNVLFDNGNKLIFLMPIEEFTLNGKIFSAMGAVYDTQDIFDVLDIEAFDGNAVLYITHGNGAILFRNSQGSLITGYNLFNSLEDADFRSGSADRLRGEILSGTQEMMTVRLDGRNYYLNHTPVGVHDWQMVMLVPADVVSRQMQQSSVLSFLCFFLISGLIVSVFILIYTDSTRKVLKAEEEARRAAESANLAKSRFLSNMSHDIRTPMNAIIGMTKIASTNLQNPDKVRDCLQKIDLSGRLLVGLINDILDMSKIESGKMVLNENASSLVELMNSLVGITQPAVRQKRQKFNVRLHDVRHEILIFDSLRLNQVLINLLGNALKFTPEGGNISVDITEKASMKEGYAHFVFRVEDTGIGMSPVFMKNLFTSFSRERDSRVDKIEGSGLGMAITRLIVTMMEGRISVESEVNKGSVFTVELDLRIQGEPEEMKLPAGRILVADDDPDTCFSAAEFLKELGLKADVAEDGRSAVRKALEAHREGQDYEMILLDWRMPDLGGVEAAREIRKELGVRVPILIISAYTWSNIETEAGMAGIDGFIQKPFFKSTLYHCVRHYVLHEEEAPVSENTEECDLNGKHILVVEDNEINLQIAVELLTEYGACVETAENGAKAVERFAGSPAGYYDLILMDIQMPVMNGYEASKAIRGMVREDAAFVPIFAMTADAFAEDREMAKQSGMNSHLSKPLDIPAMIREIRNYL